MNRTHTMPDVGSHVGSNTRGLTLLELIVVLIILVTLGTVMITQSAGVVGEARYQQTVRTLEQVRGAVIGRQPVAGEDPTAVPVGFVADIGRLPQVGASADLAELYDLTLAGSTLPSFGLQTLGTIGTETGFDEELFLACGWRGPYVRRPIGSDDLLDGWGREFVLRDAGGALVTPTAVATTEIGAVISDGSPAADGFDVVLDDVVFRDTSASVLESTGDLQVELTLEFPAGVQANDEFHVVIRVYGPINGEAGVVAQTDGEAADNDVKTFTFTAASGTTESWTVLIPDVPIGPKLIRAYQLANDAEPGTTRNEITADLTGTPNLFSDTSKSQPQQITVIQRGPVVKMTLEGER